MSDEEYLQKKIDLLERELAKAKATRLDEFAKAALAGGCTPSTAYSSAASALLWRPE